MLNDDSGIEHIILCQTCMYIRGQCENLDVISRTQRKDVSDDKDSFVLSTVASRSFNRNAETDNVLVELSCR